MREVEWETNWPYQDEAFRSLDFRLVLVPFSAGAG